MARVADGMPMRTNANVLPRRQEIAARLVAEDDIGDRAIARRCKVHTATLERWKLTEPFRLRVAEYRTALAAVIMSESIAARVNRVKALDDRWLRMQRVIRERARSKELRQVPGGKTGLIKRDVKGVGKGADFQLIDVYEVDTGLLSELRNHERQAAQELGQWIEKHSVDGEELNARIRRLMGELADRGEAEAGPGSGNGSAATTPDSTVH